MRELFPGISDEQLPKASKERFFCKYQQNTLGVVCEKKLTCESCGWNPAVEARRKTKIKERMAKK